MEAAMPKQKSSKGFFSIAIAALILSAAAQSESTSSLRAVSVDPAELAAFKVAIRAKYDMKEAAFKANDVEPIINHFYSDRVISVDSEGAVHRGRAGIRPVYEQVIGSFVAIESYESFVNGNAGWDWVNFHVSFPPEAEMDPFSFKMLFLWENIEGEWWSHGEMYVPGAFEISSQ
jgi:hypothetical protein